MLNTIRLFANMDALGKSLLILLGTFQRASEASLNQDLSACSHSLRLFQKSLNVFLAITLNRLFWQRDEKFPIRESDAFLVRYQLPKFGSAAANEHGTDLQHVTVSFRTARTVPDCPRTVLTRRPILGYWPPAEYVNFPE